MRAADVSATIYALASGSGKAAVAVIRISGPNVAPLLHIADQVRSRSPSRDIASDRRADKRRDHRSRLGSVVSCAS